MAIQLTSEMIKEIAAELDMGMKCFYHLPTATLKSYPDELRMEGDLDEEIWGETINEVEENYGEYLAFEGMESRESFRVMQDFIEDEIHDESIQQRFFDVIQRRKPFQQFKNLLLDYPDLRQQWFDYKDKRMIEYVEQQLEMYNRQQQDE